MPLKILVVEDNDWVRNVVARILESSGYEVILAANGIDALDLFNVEAPDLMITNGNMPLMDGYELCRRVRTFSSVPMILMSGSHLTSEEVSDVSSLGASFLSKPFSFSELTALVDELLTVS